MPHVAGPLHVRDIPILVDRALRDAHLGPKAGATPVPHTLLMTRGRISMRWRSRWGRAWRRVRHDHHDDPATWSCLV